jgi:actin related protein 2/3 complex subunit 1A/1B
MSEIHTLLHGIPITCHAFNKNRTLLAISPNDHTVQIYEKSQGWVLKYTLEEVIYTQ